MQVRFIIMSVVISFFLGCGCEREGTSQSCWREAVTKAESGNVVPCWVKRREGEVWLPDERPVVKNGYGMLLVCYNEAQRFYLFDNIQKRYFGTKSLPLFLKALEGLPEGVGVERIDTCTVSLARNMPREGRERIYTALEKGNHSLIGRTDGTSFFCTCGSMGLGVPWIEGEGRKKNLPGKEGSTGSGNWRMIDVQQEFFGVTSPIVSYRMAGHGKDLFYKEMYNISEKSFFLR